MGFTLDQIVPWGRCFDEYVGMFDLGPADLCATILGCGDGPAAFNAQLTQRGGRVASIDPIYAFDAAQIRQRIAQTSATVLEQLRRNAADYVWESIGSVDELARLRMTAMEDFLRDYPAGRQAGRYVAGELPALPFADAQFDLALCSHFLFLYSDHLSADFHLQALAQMLRVAREVRVFPLLALDGRRSPHLDAVCAQLAARGFEFTVRRVAYEFQRGGNEMLRIVRGPDARGATPRGI